MKHRDPHFSCLRKSSAWETLLSALSPSLQDPHMLYQDSQIPPGGAMLDTVYNVGEEADPDFQHIIPSPSGCYQDFIPFQIYRLDALPKLPWLSTCMSNFPKCPTPISLYYFKLLCYTILFYNLITKKILSLSLSQSFFNVITFLMSSSLIFKLFISIIS